MPRCPSCFTPMTRVDEEGIKFCTCPNCFGHWINNVALLRRNRMDAQAAPGSDVAPKASLADLAEIVAACDSRKPLRCTQCEKGLSRDLYHPMIPVQIDRCKPCGYVWLDAGELSMIRQLYAELMTSDDPEIVRRRDKLAAAMSAWEQKRSEDLFGPDQVDDGFDFLGHLLRGL